MNKSIIFFLLVLASCSGSDRSESNELFVVVLGIAQDAGSPQIGCDKECCSALWSKPGDRQKVVSLGIVDRQNNEVWILDATPDFKDQFHDLLSYLPDGNINSLKGIFLTHAHIGHYTGIMDLGREAMGARQVPVYAMPKMADYLTTNGPWSQLVDLNNINIKRLSADEPVVFNDNIKITPFLVPHRDEYSETVGYKVESSKKSFLFIPDIDKWHKWQRSIVDEVMNTDYAFLDGAFLSEDELPNRNMAEIPHPFVPETMELFKDASADIRGKIVFIHLNHTNRLLKNGQEVRNIESSGYQVGREGQVYLLE